MSNKKKKKNKNSNYGYYRQKEQEWREAEEKREREANKTKNLILIHSRDNRILVLTKCDLTDTEQADVKRLLQTVGVPCRFKKA